MQQQQPSPSSTAAASTSTPPAPDAELHEHLASFLRLTTQAPLEYVCKSAIYLLRHVPSARFAVLEYIGTFYKVASFLNLRFTLSQRNPNVAANSAVDPTQELNNIAHINQVIELVETSLLELLTAAAATAASGGGGNNDIWCIELASWLIDLIGEIVINAGTSVADTPGLSIGEINALKEPSIFDGLDIWANQCKPTQSILLVVHKCFSTAAAHASHAAKLAIVDIILNASIKYAAKFDWLLCYVSSLDPQAFFAKLLLFGLKESAATLPQPPQQPQAQQPPPSAQQQQQQQRLSRINIINFYALNYAELVRAEVASLLAESRVDAERRVNKFVLVFVLRMAAQSTAMLHLLLNDVQQLAFAPNNANQRQRDRIDVAYLIPYVLECDTCVIDHMFASIEQLNNSVAVYDLLVGLLDWLNAQCCSIELGDEARLNEFKMIQACIVSYVVEIIASEKHIHCRRLRRM